MKKSDKIGQDQKTLISAFAEFLTAIFSKETRL